MRTVLAYTLIKNRLADFLALGSTDRMIGPKIDHTFLGKIASFLLRPDLLMDHPSWPG